jgi:hypothetical protein
MRPFPFSNPVTRRLPIKQILPRMPFPPIPLQVRSHLLSGLIMLSFSGVAAQSTTHSENYWHSGAGLSEGTINFQGNGTGGLSLLYRYDLLKSTNSTLSLGTNIKIGTADRIGIVFPLIVGLLLLDPDPGSAFNGNNASDTGKSGEWIGFFSDLPLLLNYNFGLGSDDFTKHRFGFYFGGGMTFTVTAISNNSGVRQNTSFLGWVLNAGIRFGKDKDIGFSMTSPLRNPIGPIDNPIFYQITYSVFDRPKRTHRHPCPDIDNSIGLSISKIH